MDYTLIKYEPEEELDNYFKRLILKICQLFPYYNKDIKEIAKQLQDYRELLESKRKNKQEINKSNVLNSLKRFDSVMSNYFNKEETAKSVFINQLKIILKLLDEPFNEQQYKSMPFAQLYQLNKDKYEQLTPENKEVFFDKITSNKQNKEVMKILKLWYPQKEKQLRNKIRDEIAIFKGTLKQDVFKDVNKDIKEYITKNNDSIKKDVKNLVYEQLSGSVLDKLRTLTTVLLNDPNNRLTAVYKSKLKKFKDLQDQYKPLIVKYEQASEDLRPSIKKEMENAIYEMTPLYNELKEQFKTVNKYNDQMQIKQGIINRINGINKLNISGIQDLYNDYMKNKNLFNSEEIKKYEPILKDAYLNKSSRVLHKHGIKTENINDGIKQYLIKILPNTKNKNDDYYYADNAANQKQGIVGQIKSTVLNRFKSLLNTLLIEFKDEEPENFDIINNVYKEALKDDDKLYNLVFDLLDNPPDDLPEEPPKTPPPEDTEFNKQSQTLSDEIESTKDKDEDEEDENKVGPGEEVYDKIKNPERKTIKSLLQQINKYYGKNKNIEGIIYYYAQKRNYKGDKDKLFIELLKKYNRNYDKDKHNKLINEGKYTLDYVNELKKGGFILSGLINLGKKIFGLNSDILGGGEMPASETLRINGDDNVGHSPSTVKIDNQPQGSGILSGILGALGLSEDVLRGSGIFSSLLGAIGLGNEALKDNKYKPIFDLLKKEKDNDKVDSYLFAIAKLDNDEDVSDDINKKFKLLQYKYDETYRPKLFKKRLDKDYYKNCGSFAPALLGLIPMGINAISGLISSISQAARGNGCDNKKIGGKIMSLKELEAIKEGI